MDNQRLHQLIENPEGFTAENLAELAKLCEQFPFCGTFKQLYLIGLKEHNDVTFGKKLTEFAAWIPSRKILKDIIEEKAKLAQQKPRFEEPILLSAEPSMHQTQLAEESTIAATSLVPHEDSAESIPSFAEKTERLATQEELTEEKHTEEEHIEEGEPVLSPSKPKAITHIPVYNVDELLQASQETTPKEPVKRKFTDWLKPKQHVEEEKPEINKQKIQQNIIDRFIKTQPKITHPKEYKASENQLSASNISMVNKEDYITETLAQVYEKQGNYAKAISCYGKLKLKYPEKSDYFAAQIKKLNETKNS
ncbi:MAG: hypothetical protein ACXITV_09665 [Luteibaculaceae bacterium]